MKSPAQHSLLTKNRPGPVTEADRLQLNGYIEVLKALSRLTYESVYVIDYEHMSFDHVSVNPLFLSGHTAAEVQQMGYEFYFRNVPEQDLELLAILNDAGFDFFEKVPREERKTYSITYDFHLRNASGKEVLINHKLTPLFLNASGKIWKAVCIVSISHHKTAGNVIIHKQGTEELWTLDTKTRRWHKSSKPKLTERETEVLRLYAQGMTINQIADKLHVVPDTVKYYRRKIFENFEVANIVEALAYAMHHKII